jgi:hypothetical protein
MWVGYFVPQSNYPNRLIAVRGQDALRHHGCFAKINACHGKEYVTGH